MKTAATVRVSAERYFVMQAGRLQPAQPLCPWRDGRLVTVFHRADDLGARNGLSFESLHCSWPERRQGNTASCLMIV
jgi:hypothetical protein